MKNKIKYKASKPRYSEFRGENVVDIYKRKTALFGLISYWSISSTIVDVGQVDEIVMLLNNPGELKKRIGSIILTTFPK